MVVPERKAAIDLPPEKRTRATVVVWPAVRGETGMPRKRFSTEQIITMLREAEVKQAQGMSIREICKGLQITDQTYFRWRREYGGLKLDQAKRLKDLEKENARLKRVVADQVLDIAILKEAASGNF
jgi:putative transposase